MKTTILQILIISLLLASCSDNRKADLDRKEQALMEREQQLSRKEAEFQRLLRMRDSLMAQQTDTSVTARWPESLTGSWNCKMVCTESNCTNYVVGDQRTDVWEFTGDSSGIYTRVISNNKLLRTYQAQYDTAGIALHFVTDSTAAKMVTMKVLLQQNAADNLKGIQTTTMENGCTAKFSVDLSRSSN